VANSQTTNATLIDPVALDVLPRKVSTAMGPEDVAFSNDGRFLFATGYYEKVVTIADVETGERVGEPISFTATPRRLLPSRDGRRLFVLLHSDPGAVAVVDLESRAVTANVPVGPFPSDLVLTPDGLRLLVASFDGNSVTVIDLASLAPVDTLAMDTGYGLVAHPTKTLLYSMVSFDDQVLVFDYRTRQPGAAITVGAWPTYSAITPDGRFLYVVNRDSNNVVKVDTEAGEALLRIATGMTPQAAVLFAPDAAGVPVRGRTVVAVLLAVGLFGVWRLRRRAASEGGGPHGSTPSLTVGKQPE
jgi:DNA-binding beta-propeller fold protein YncE